MSVIDLNQEREARAPQQSEVLAIAIAKVDAQLDRLAAHDDTESTLLMTKLWKEKATLVRKQITAQKQEEREALKAAQASLPASAVDEQIKADIRTWLIDNDYYYTHSDATYWLFTPGARSPWMPCARSSLVNHDVRLDSRSPYFDLFTEVLHEDKRWFRDHARTFAKVGPNTLNMLRWDFLPPVAPAPGESHSWVFDALIHSLSGGKPENVEHIERVLVAKYLNPANYTLPTIVISDGGGTGTRSAISAWSALMILIGTTDDPLPQELVGQVVEARRGRPLMFPERPASSGRGCRAGVRNPLRDPDRNSDRDHVREDRTVGRDRGAAFDERDPRRPRPDRDHRPDVPRLSQREGQLRWSLG